MSDGFATVLAALDAHAARHPERRAVDDVTYGALRDGTYRVARRLHERGVRAGDRIGLYAENSLAFVFAYLGAMRSGAVVVPTNVLYRAGDLARVVSDAEPIAMFVSTQSRPFASAASGTRVDLIDLAEVVAWASDASISAGVPRDVASPSPEDLALLVYTSGTTGRAKGAMLTHGNLAAIATDVVTAWAWTAADTLLLTLPLFHVHGLGAGLNGTLVAGGRLRLRERFDATDVAATLGRGEATMFFGVPTMYVRLLELPGSEPLSSVRLFVSGSAALSASVHEAFASRFGASILERYGSTEFGFALTHRYAGPRYAGTVGFPFPNVAVRLVDAADRDVAASEIGEILVSGRNVCAGYWRDPQATEAAFFVADGERWYRTGDLASFDCERGYRIVGRTKELIISGGFNVYPREIEDELLTLDGVRAAAVVGIVDPARGELPLAFVEAAAGLDCEAVLATLRTRLASFKVPKRIEVVDELPRNAMGKVDKPRLREHPAVQRA
ncbi:MAG: acyl-CoA synthetase [Vulcanimicrobiaceae bacterium]